MTSRHGSPCRIASGREREESSEQEDRQATVSIPYGSHGHKMSNCRAIRPGRRDRRGPCHIETRVSVRLTMPNDSADASAACRHVGSRGPVDAPRRTRDGSVVRSSPRRGTREIASSSVARTRRSRRDAEHEVGRRSAWTSIMLRRVVGGNVSEA
jgi:hypothetical protein